MCSGANKAKEFFPSQNNRTLSIGKCDAGKSLSKDLIIDLDVIFDQVLTEEYTFVSQKSIQSKVKGDIKFGLGSKEIGIGTELNTSNTTTVSRSFKRVTNVKNINLIKTTIRYYDPILNPDGSFHIYDGGDISFTLNTL